MNLLGGVRASAAVERKVVEASGGNPLYVEEFLGMLVDEGLIRREENEWSGTVDLASIPTPASIMVLLAARLDRLPPEQLEVLELASVIGEVFTTEAVGALDDSTPRQNPLRHVESLVRRELVRPDPDDRDGESFRFRHILIRDAAYGRIPKRKRIALHQRLAEWIASREEMAGSLTDEIVGAHLEQAYGYRRELGPVDDRAVEVGRAAASHLAAAGRRALNAGVTGMATGLLDRAAGLLPSDDPLRLAVLADLSDAHWERAELERARATTNELLDRAAAAGLEDLRQRAVLQVIALDFASGVQLTELGPRAAGALAYFKKHGGERELGIAWRVFAETEMLAGRFEQGRIAHLHAVEQLEQAGDLRGASMSRMDIAGIDLDGPATMATALQTAASLRDWGRAAGLTWAEASASRISRGSPRCAVDTTRHGACWTRRRRSSGLWTGRFTSPPTSRGGRRGSRRPPGTCQWPKPPCAAGTSSSIGSERTQWARFMAAELARVLYLQGRYQEASEVNRLAAAGGDSALDTRSPGNSSSHSSSRGRAGTMPRSRSLGPPSRPRTGPTSSSTVPRPARPWPRSSTWAAGPTKRAPCWRKRWSSTSARARRCSRIASVPDSPDLHRQPG